MTLTPTNRTPILTEWAAHRAFSRWNTALATGRRIRWAREQAEVSLEELAAFAGMSSRTLARIEHGQRALSGRERAAVARGLGVSIGFLAVGTTHGRRDA